MHTRVFSYAERWGKLGFNRLKTGLGPMATDATPFLYRPLSSARRRRRHSRRRRWRYDS